MLGESVYSHWRFMDWSIWEGRLPAECVACLRVLAVVLVMLFIAVTVQRRESYNAKPRKN